MRADQTMHHPDPSLAQEYERGEAFRALAARYGRTERTIRRHIGDLVQARPSGPQRLAVSDEEISRLRGEGLSWRAIARQVGMSEAGVRKRHRAADQVGVPGSPAGTKKIAPTRRS